jgi:hypothetical protein
LPGMAFEIIFPMTVSRFRLGHRDFLYWEGPAGPWRGVSGEGRVRRGEPVIVVKKIDVHVHRFWGLGINGQTG